MVRISGNGIVEVLMAFKTVVESDEDLCKHEKKLIVEYLDKWKPKAIVW